MPLLHRDLALVGGFSRLPFARFGTIFQSMPPLLPLTVRLLMHLFKLGALSWEFCHSTPVLACRRGPTCASISLASARMRLLLHVVWLIFSICVWKSPWSDVWTRRNISPLG